MEIKKGDYILISPRIISDESKIAKVSSISKSAFYSGYLNVKIESTGETYRINPMYARKVDMIEILDDV